MGIVYYMECQCGMFYFGKTKRPFFHSFRDHVGLVNAKKFEIPISYKLPHGAVPSIRCHKDEFFFALEYIPLNERGANCFYNEKQNGFLICLPLNIQG